MYNRRINVDIFDNFNEQGKIKIVDKRKQSNLFPRDGHSIAIVLY